MAHPTAGPLISVVLPVCDERDNLNPLVERLYAVLNDAAGGDFELVFVDDASSDGSADIIAAHHARDTRVKLIELSRNFGHQAALQAGLDAARGRAVVMMDADLQDPPELLRELIAGWRDGHEVVYAVRRTRAEGLLKRTAYRTFYRTVARIASIDVPLDAGDFCLLDRNVVDALVRLPEHNRYLRGLRSWVGFRQLAIEYDRGARHAGESKYGLGKLIALAVSGYVGFSAMPLRLAAAIGMLSSVAGFLLFIWAIGTKLLHIESPRGWASLMAVLLLVGGVQLLVLGVVGEYLGRVYDEVRRRPLYLVRKRLGVEAPPPSFRDS